MAKNIFLQAPKGLALHQACAEGRTSVVEWLLEFSRETYYSFTYRDGYGQTAIHHAVIKDNIDVVKILQSEKDADHFHGMEVWDYKGILPIHLATKNGFFVFSSKNWLMLVLQTMNIIAFFIMLPWEVT